MSAYTPRASLSVGGYRGFAAILLTDTAAQLCAAFFDRPGYPAPRCTFRPAFTAAGRIVRYTCNLASVLDESLRLSAAHTLGGGHRSFDIMHVAAALVITARDFLTFDDNQRRLAEAEGLTVPY